ncbi:MAG: TIGR01777 family oxidoreductase [Cyanobacteria bacterium REEB67]|nr:TIGR01777 family oxidoreductase [Cyanobacteria bacterium REEB67]
MKNQIFESQVHLAHSAETAFSWHERDGAFERLSPPWMEVKCAERSGGIQDGGRVVLLLVKGPVQLPWVMGHKDYVPNQQFVDYQIAGPFQYWQHIHSFAPDATGGGSILNEHIEFRLPLGVLGQIFGAGLIKADLQRLFRYRHALTRRDLAMQKRYGGRSLKILVTGGNGLVGKALIPFLTTQGHRVVQLVRKQSPKAELPLATVEKILWDPEKGTIDAPLPDDLDGVVHLAGYNVAARGWTPGVKRSIEESRVKSTAYLVKLFSEMKRKPPVFVCASAMDFYGDRGSEPVTEDSGGGDSFLAGVCRKWEAAANEARSLNMRVVNLRISAVLSPKGAALGKLLPVFKAGGGGPVGSGEQYFSWISLDDMLGCIYHSLVEETVEGPLNAVAPGCLTNRQFGSTLAGVLGRPALVPLPEAVVQVLFGELGEALLLTSRRLLPQKLKQTGYQFLDPELAPALKYMLGLSAGYSSYE